MATDGVVAIQVACFKKAVAMMFAILYILNIQYPQNVAVTLEIIKGIS